MNAPSCPVSPTALPPCWLMRPTISWLSSPSTISTTFITLVVGDAHALPEFALDAHLLQQVADLRAAAVDDHRVHPHQLQHHDVAREAGLERGLRHRVAAVLDDDRLVVEAPDVRQRFGQDLRLQRGIDGVDGHGGASGQWSGGRAAGRNAARIVPLSARDRIVAAAMRRRVSADAGATRVRRGRADFGIVVHHGEPAARTPFPCPKSVACSSPSCAITATCC